MIKNFSIDGLASSLFAGTSKIVDHLNSTVCAEQYDEFNTGNSG